MTSAFDEYRLENIALDHRIGAGVFVPFVIARLQIVTGFAEQNVICSFHRFEEEVQ